MELSCRVCMGRESGGTLGARPLGIYGEGAWRDTWSSAGGIAIVFGAEEARRNPYLELSWRLAG